MATEKRINSRLLLRYDSLANWQEKNPTLLAGEMAIAYLAPSHTTTTPDNGTHAVIFKVGPGAFNSLPFASALAADVYSWAKQSEEEFADNFLGMMCSNGAVMAEHLDAIFVNHDELTQELAHLQNYIALQFVGDSEISVSVSEHEDGDGGRTVTINHNKMLGEESALDSIGASTASISGYGATGTLQIPKLAVNEYGHVTGLSTETVSIQMPAAQEIPNISIVEDSAAEVPTVEVVNVYKNLTANGHALTEELVEVATKNIEVFNTDIVTVNALGGIAAGTDLNGLTTRQILNKLLFPYVAQEIGTVSRTPGASTVERGNDQTITQVQVVVTKKSEPITSVALYKGTEKLAEKTGTEVAAGGTFTFSNLSVKITANTSSVAGLEVKVTDASGNVVKKSTSGWTFVYPYYYGVCADGATINEALVESLTKKVESKGTKTDWSFTCNNQCMVFAYPKAHGVLKSIIDPNNFEIIGSFTKSEVSITGLDGTAQAYYVYVSGAGTASDFKVDFKY